jgi:acyl-CoA thioesterase-2
VLALQQLLDVLTFEPTGEGPFRAQNAGGGRDVVLDGQILARTIIAAANAQPEKEANTVQTVFARGGRMDQPLDLTR